MLLAMPKPEVPGDRPLAVAALRATVLIAPSPGAGPVCDVRLGVRPRSAGGSGRDPPAGLATGDRARGGQVRSGILLGLGPWESQGSLL